MWGLNEYFSPLQKSYFKLNHFIAELHFFYFFVAVITFWVSDISPLLCKTKNTIQNKSKLMSDLQISSILFIAFKQLIPKDKVLLFPLQ